MVRTRKGFKPKAPGSPKESESPSEVFQMTPLSYRLAFNDRDSPRRHGTHGGGTEVSVFLCHRQAGGRFRLCRKPKEAPGPDPSGGNPNPAPPLCLCSVPPWWILND